MIHPFEYQEVIKDTYFDAEHSIPFMLTAYIIVYKKDGYIGVIKTMKYKILEDFENYEEVEQDVISLYKNKIPKKLLDIWKEYGFGSFMDNYIKIINPNEYIIQNGKLNFEECFGYVPLLGLGGSEKVENLKKVKIKEHIELITQMVGKIEFKEKTICRIA